MNHLKKIFGLAKKAARELVDSNDLTPTHLEEYFSKSDAVDIVDHLTNDDEISERKHHLEIINKSKKKDWEKVSYGVIRKTQRDFSLAKLAAVLIVFVSIGYLSLQYLGYFNRTQESSISAIPLDDIILSTANGNKTILTNDTQKKEVFNNNAVFNENNGKFILDYSSKVNQNIPSNLVYNELNVPFGRSLKVILADGSKVHLNSGSKLKYPIQFLKEGNRKVHLEGEAYFEITKNKYQPFVVEANNMYVEVLGTIFNIMAYPEDSKITTILEEGSVAIGHLKETTNQATVILKPNDQALWDKKSGEITINTVKPSIYTAWTEGRTVFDHMLFKNILKKLERRYNVEISNNNEILANEQFTATFDYESIEQVLESFSKNYPFTYSLEGNKITIN
ncbi:MAG: FecR family protein [Jejuia sp.]